jgi:threonyl-tRNA synthetase
MNKDLEIELSHRGKKEKIKIKKGQTIKSLLTNSDKDIIAARVNEKLVDLSTKINSPMKIELISNNSAEGLEIMRHSCAHVLAQAILRLYPNAKLTIGPVVEEGFYYDIDLEHPFTQEDIQKIEKEMSKIKNQAQEFERRELTKKEALELYKDNKYKQEIINELDESYPISVYYNKDLNGNIKFFDLCTGPHVPDTSKIGEFKILKIAGAYWRADSKREQLQRVYGISFPTKKELDDYLKRLEEALQRDHRKIGKELELIMFSEMAPGMVFFLPDGMIIRNELENFLKEEQKKLGYVEVKTPIIINTKVWETSGHWEHYKDNMYFTNIDEQKYGIKPMNCPGHMLVFANSAKSYRELPLKIAEFGLVHRHELSGVLSGMTRVRAFTQDDAHIFCTPEQVEEVVIEVLELIKKVLKIFEFEYEAALSTRPEKFIGTIDMWDKAENALKNALKKANIEYKLNEGDGAFYGPKIDFKVKDAIGRMWQLSTCQLDFQMPLRFGLKYEGSDGKMHTPVTIHRAIYGSMERFIGILIEHYAGKFPLWLSPTQVILIPILPKHFEFAKSFEQKLKENGIRVKTNLEDGTLNSKVREAQLKKIPYIIIIGDKEMQDEKLKIRQRDGKLFDIKKEEFIEYIKNKIKNKDNKI